MEIIVKNLKTEQDRQLKLKRFNEGVIKCIRCRNIKPLIEFSEKPKNTLIPYNSVCNECSQKSRNSAELKILQEHEKYKNKWYKGLENIIHNDEY
jgi:hypothetical protein